MHAASRPNDAPRPEPLIANPMGHRALDALGDGTCVDPAPSSNSRELPIYRKTSV